MLEFVELYKNLPTPPPKTKKKSYPSRRNRFDRSSKIAIPPLPLTMRITRLLLGSFTFWLMATLSLSVGAILAVFDAKMTVNVPEWQLSPTPTTSPLPPFKLSRPLNILILGVETINTPENAGQFREQSPAQTVWLMRFNPVQNSVSVLLVPPQTRVEIPDRGRNQIARAHTIGGVTLTSRVLSQTLNSIPIDRYIRADAATFRSFIDLLGGVELFVPEALSYRDSTQAIAVDLQPGWQTLKGEETLGFARSQKDSEDHSAIHREQLILQSVGDRLASPSLLPQLPRIVQLMHEYIDTNLTLEETFALVNFLQQQLPDGLKMVLLPGEFTPTRSVPSPSWTIDPTGRDRVMYYYFERELNSGNQRNRATTAQSPHNLKIALQNASGNPLILGKILNDLKAHGYQNVYAITDSLDIKRRSQIIVQAGDREAAQTLQKLLPIAQIQSSSLGDLNSELTLIIGEDFVDF